MHLDKIITWLLFGAVIIVMGFQSLIARPVLSASPGLADNQEQVKSDSMKAWRVQLGGRLQFQSRASFIEPREQTTQLAGELRRFRVKLYGGLPRHNISFYMQPSFDGAEAGLELAYIAWTPWDRTTITVGQFKVPATRQFMISSGKLQLVDRSFADATHRLLYDVGVMVRHRFDFGSQSLLQVYGSVTTGEGKNRPSAEGGYSYTVRTEFLPLGDFNQYRISDLTQSNQFRFSGALAYNLNVDAVHTGGSVGTYMRDFRSDIGTIYGDLLLKYGGWSLFSQGSWREGSPAFSRHSRNVRFKIKEGYTFLVQSGYMVTDKMEMIGRLALYKPSDQVDYFYGMERRHTLGLTRFIQNNDLKLQFDVTYIDRSVKSSLEEELLVRGQIQLDF